MDLALHVGHPLASVLCPDRRELKEWLIRGLWLTQAGVKEEYQMRAEPEAAVAGVTLQQPEACYVFTWRSCPWVTGP